MLRRFYLKPNIGKTRRLYTSSCAGAAKSLRIAEIYRHLFTYEQRRSELDRQLHLGHRRRRAARPLRARQVPRRDPADDRAAPPRRRARADQAGRARHEGLARQGGIVQPGPGAAPGRRPGVLQHVEVHAARPQGPRQPAAAQGRLRGLPRRLLAERAGHPRELRVPQPDPAPLQGRRARHADREVPRSRTST